MMRGTKRVSGQAGRRPIRHFVKLVDFDTIDVASAGTPSVEATTPSINEFEMPTGPDMLKRVLEITKGHPPEEEYWLDIQEKLDLCKLKASDLENQGYEGAQVAKAASALSHQDVQPLGKLIGRPLRVKFRVLTARDKSSCAIRCQGEDNAVWLQNYLVSQFPKSEISAPSRIDDIPMWEMKIVFDKKATPFEVQQALFRCPAALLIQLYQVRVAEQPHFRIHSHNLSAWIKDQKDSIWWTVDGDPLLMSRLEFPAPPDELGTELERIGRTLLVADPVGDGAGEELTPEEVNRAVRSDDFGKRHLLLSWEEGASDWILSEDEPTTDSSSN